MNILVYSSFMKQQILYLNRLGKLILRSWIYSHQKATVSQSQTYHTPKEIYDTGTITRKVGTGKEWQDNHFFESRRLEESELILRTCLCMHTWKKHPLVEAMMSLCRVSPSIYLEYSTDDNELPGPPWHPVAISFCGKHCLWKLQYFFQNIMLSRDWFKGLPVCSFHICLSFIHLFVHYKLLLKLLWEVLYISGSPNEQVLIRILPNLQLCKQGL